MSALPLEMRKSEELNHIDVVSLQYESLEFLGILMDEQLPVDEIEIHREINDDIDRSCHPSYTNFQLPYDVVCRLRYRAQFEKYNRQFKHELEQLEVMQSSAYDALRFNSLLSLSTLCPPMHTRKKIKYYLQECCKLSAKQEARLNYLLGENRYV